VPCIPVYAFLWICCYGWPTSSPSCSPCSACTLSSNSDNTELLTVKKFPRLHPLATSSRRTTLGSGYKAQTPTMPRNVAVPAIAILPPLLTARPAPNKMPSSTHCGIPRRTVCMSRLRAWCVSFCVSYCTSRYSFGHAWTRITTIGPKSAKMPRNWLRE